jgi:hypothetical protein
MKTKSTWIWGLSGFSLALACQPEPAVVSGEDVAAADEPAVLSAQAALIPRITSVSPPLASNLGGANLTLTGRSFGVGAQVFVAGQPVSSAYVTTSTLLQLQLPRATFASGPVTVKIVNPDGRQSERSDVLTLFDDRTALSGLRTPVSATSMGGPAQIVATADFDGDGLLDVLGQDYSRLYVLRSRGRAGFVDWQAVDMPSFGMPITPEVADVNGDGKPDVVAGSTYGGGIQVLLNRGDGTLQPPVSTMLGTMSGYYGSTLADVNKDGRADLLLVSNVFLGMSPYAVAVYPGGSDGRFATTPITTALLESLRLSVRDVNGDGHADLVGASSRAEVSVLLGNSSGTFAAPTAVTLDSPARELAMVDLNGDGKLDLATLGSDGKLSLRVGHGDGTFSGTGLVTVATAAATLSAADLTGDGKADLIVGSDRTYGPGSPSGSPGGAWLLRGNGDATVQMPQEVSLFPLWGVNRLRIADADRDGKLDILAFGDSTMLPIFNRGGGSFFEDRQFAAPINAVAAADVNGDGKADIVSVAVSVNKVYVALNAGDGTTAAPRAYDTDRGPAAVAVADLTGDGKADLVIANYDAGTVSLLPGNGDGSFQPQRIFPVAYGANALIVQDMNNDMRPDVVTANYESNNVSVLLNAGMGTLGTAKNYAAAASPAALVAADLNKDGRMDIVTANPDGNNLSYLQGSAVTAGALNAARLIGSGGRGPAALSARDVTGDGNVDLISGNGDSGDITLLPGRGDGTVSASSVIASSGRVSDLLLSDVTGDGRPDLIVSTGGASGGTTQLLYGFAGGVFAPSARSIAYAGALAVSDLTGDGKPDLLVARLSGMVSLHINRSL